MSAGGGAKVVLMALAANLGLAAFKYFAAWMSGSSSMLAEGHHSLADTLNQVLLFVGLKRSALPPSDRHPFGYGKVQFFWSFVVALTLFGVAGGMAVKGGIHKMLHPEPMGDALWSYLAIGVGLFLDSIALRAAYKELRARMAETGETSLARAFRECTDAVVITVLMEDALALLGLALAGAGIMAAQLTGWHAADGLASILIGVALMVFAFLLALELKSMLVGEGLPARERERVRAALSGDPAVKAVADLRTMLLGPEDALVAADVELALGTTAAQAEEAAARLEAKVRQARPGSRLYLHPRRRG